MNKLFEIIKHEFKLTAMNRLYLVMTILGPLLIFAVSVLPTLITRNTTLIKEGSVIGIVTEESSLTYVLSAVFTESGIEIDPEGTVEEQMNKVLDGKNIGFLIVPEDYLESNRIEFYTKSGTDIALYEIVKGILSKVIVSQRLAERGLDSQEIAHLSRNPELVSKRISTTGETRQQDFLSVLLTALAFVMLLYMTTLLYGQMIGRSVVLEKSSKTVEIMLSSVRPLDILFGKIIGRGAAGLLQYGIWVSVALLLIKFLDPVLSIQSSINLEPEFLGFLIIFFILAFLLYSSAYGALGAGAEDDQHLGQLGWPLIIFLVLPIVMISPIVMNPDAPFVIALSYFPMTSPLVMFIRILINKPPAWEILISMAILIATIIGMIYAAAKIFRVGILMTGKRVSFREILRWIKY